MLEENLERIAGMTEGVVADVPASLKHELPITANNRYRAKSDSGLMPHFQSRTSVFSGLITVFLPACP